MLSVNVHSQGPANPSEAALRWRAVEGQVLPIKKQVLPIKEQSAQSHRCVKSWGAGVQPWWIQGIQSGDGVGDQDTIELKI